MYQHVMPFPFATICFCLFLTRCFEGLLWLVVDVAEWRDSAADLPADAKRCMSTVLSNRQAFLKADARNRHKVALRRTCSALSFCFVTRCCTDVWSAAAADIVASAAACRMRASAPGLHSLL